MTANGAAQTRQRGESAGQAGAKEAEFTIYGIHEAIARAKAECSPVGKDGWNPQQNFKFRGVDAVVNGAAKALNRYGVVITTRIKLKRIEKRTYQSKNGANMLHVLVPVRFEIFGADGSGPVVVEVVGESADSGDKVISKATSVAYRIMLIQLLNLPTGDPDPDSQTHERGESAASGGDPWESATPARGNRRGNGGRRSQGNGHAQSERPSQPMKPRPPLDDDDPWKAKAEELASADDARAAEAELQELWQAGQVDDDRANQILYAIRQRFPKDAQAAANGSGQNSPPATEQASQQPSAAGQDTTQDPVLQEWAAKIDKVTDYVTCLELHEELNAAEEAKAITPHTAAGIRRAIEAKRGTLDGGPMAQNATPRPSRNRGPSAEERGAKPVPTGKGDDGEWVQGFMQRLAEASEDHLAGLQAQIGNAVRAKTISPAKSADLSKAIRERRAELQKVPA